MRICGKRKNLTTDCTDPAYPDRRHPDASRQRTSGHKRREERELRDRFNTDNSVVICGLIWKKGEVEVV